jgi:hypothetical protein
MFNYELIKKSGMTMGGLTILFMALDMVNTDAQQYSVFERYILNYPEIRKEYIEARFSGATKFRGSKITDFKRIEKIIAHFGIHRLPMIEGQPLAFGFAEKITFEPDVITDGIHAKPVEFQIQESLNSEQLGNMLNETQYIQRGHGKYYAEGIQTFGVKRFLASSGGGTDVFSFKQKYFENMLIRSIPGEHPFLLNTIKSIEVKKLIKLGMAASIIAIIFAACKESYESSSFDKNAQAMNISMEDMAWMIENDWPMFEKIILDQDPIFTKALSDFTKDIEISKVKLEIMFPEVHE